MGVVYELNVVKVPPVPLVPSPPPWLLSFLNSVAPCSAATKCLDIFHYIGQQRRMPRPPVQFVADTSQLETRLLGLKEVPCPNCRKIGTLNRHSRCLGNDLNAPGESMRGQRAFCSDRGKRPGCGRTFSIFLASVLPRHTITAPLFWKLLLQWLSGSTIWASHKTLGLPFGRDGAYALLRRLRRRLDGLRSWLCRRTSPPSSAQSDPLLQTVEHFRAAFPNCACCLAEFQNHFQVPVLG